MPQSAKQLMMQCPKCDVQLPYDDKQGQKAHMEKNHPEVIEERLRDGGFAPDGKGGWLDLLADPDS
jgi:hypothetical protein